MSFLYDRIAKIVVGTTNSQALVFDERFRITFNIPKVATSTPAISNMSIYNLSESDRRRLGNIPKENLQRKSSKQEPLIILLFAGYKEGNGYELLYSGNVSSVEDVYTPPNYITKISCGNGLIPISETTLQLSYEAGISTNSIISQISKVLKMDISKASNYVQTNTVFAQGYSYSGLARDALNEIVKEVGCRWTVEKGQLLITELNKFSNETIVELNKDSGLIGIPTRSANEQVGDIYDDGKYDGWDIKALLQPIITPNRQIKVTSKEETGVFLVDTVTHKGDTRGQEWISEVETRAVGLGGI